MTVLEFALAYAVRCGASAGYAEQLRVLTKRLHWDVSDLTVEKIDAYLTVALKTLAPQTVQNHRRMLNTLRRAAMRDGVMVDQCTRNLRRVKCNRPLVRAWSHDEIRHLLSVASQMSGSTHACPLRILLPAYILVGYASGLRLGDMLQIRHDQIRGKRLSLVLNKTGQPHVVVLTDQSLAAIATLPRRSRIFGDLVSRRQLINHFRKLMKRSGLPGSSKFLRRSSATYAEIAGINPTGHLGHLTPGLAQRHYIDQLLVGEGKRSVPELELVDHS
jgi:integrase